MPTAVLAIGFVLVALVAGVYFAFTTAVMPGLARTDEGTYVVSMQRINETILNPWFLTAFTGGLVVPVAAVLLHLGPDAHARLPWIVAGAALYAATVVITRVFNIPLNNQLMAAGDVGPATAPAVRAAYHDRWTRSNDARTVLAVAATAALAVALAQPIG